MVLAACGEFGGQETLRFLKELGDSVYAALSGHFTAGVDATMCGRRAVQIHVLGYNDAGTGGNRSPGERKLQRLDLYDDRATGDQLQYSVRSVSATGKATTAIAGAELPPNG